MIILSKQAKEYQKIITKLAILHLGENECQRLRVEAEKIRKGVVKSERKKVGKMEIVKKIYLRKRKEPDFRLDQYLSNWVKMSGCSREELLEFFSVKKNGPV
jgi:hypothetical protein